MQLPSIICPECNSAIAAVDLPIGQPAPIARTLNHCLRKCPSSGIGFSNQNTSDVKRLTRIYNSPAAMWPDEINAMCGEVIDLALNETNRENKRNRLCFSTSEDHVTWTIFRYLQLSGQLAKVLKDCHVIDGGSEPDMLLWGAPVPAGSSAGAAIRAELVKITDRLGETPRRRSEPDVIVSSPCECGSSR
jgi:hypothetical protein